MFLRRDCNSIPRQSVPAFYGWFLRMKEMNSSFGIGFA